MSRALGIWAMALVIAGAAELAAGNVLADAASNTNWPLNPAADYAGGEWRYCKRVAPGTEYENLSPLDPYSWPHGGGTVYGCANGYWSGTATAPWMYLHDATSLAALPWNSGSAQGSENDEEQICLVWKSGVAGAIKLKGDFTFAGRQQAAVSIWRDNGTGLQELLSETVLTPPQPTLHYDINTSVAQDEEIWFVVGTGLVPYTGEDNETVFSATILPEPAMLTLMLASAVTLIRRRSRSN